MLWRRDPFFECFRASFGEEELLSCQHDFIGFCNLVLANCTGVTASKLLRIAIAHVVPVFSGFSWGLLYPNKKPNNPLS